MEEGWRVFLLESGQNELLPIWGTSVSAGVTTLQAAVLEILSLSCNQSVL